ncbi:Glutamate receptor 1 [Lamellibrachia satsuma]|nr:Glutamate receptor 1 [Lamellibrachia satsuma]
MTTQMLEYLGTWRPTSGLVASFTDIWTFSRFSNKTYTIATIHVAEEYDSGQPHGDTGGCVQVVTCLVTSTPSLLQHRTTLSIKTMMTAQHFERHEVLLWAVFWTWTMHCARLAVIVHPYFAVPLSSGYRLVEPPDQMWGGPSENGSWNGMIGMVLRGEADFALAKFTITSIRKEVVDFAFPFWYGPSVLVMKKPEESGMFVYLSPFRYDFWLSFVFAVPVMSFSIACVFYVESAIFGEVNTQSFSTIVADSFWFTFGSVFQQGQ